MILNTHLNKWRFVFLTIILSINNEGQKLRVFDFDDTLVKTSSFIYITNGNKKPN